MHSALQATSREQWRIVWLSRDFDDVPSPSLGLQSHPIFFDHVTAIEPMRQALEARDLEAVVTVLPVAGCAPEEILEEVQRARASIPVIFINSSFRAPDAVRLTRLGANQCLDAMPSEEEIVRLLEDVVGERPDRQLLPEPDASADPWRSFFIGSSRAFRQIEHIIRLAAKRRSTVLITGETGTGKEMVARALHMAGPRSRFPMVSVNCGALPGELLEAEFFGHVKGAFTGAANLRIGRFEQAHQGTLFLDEVGELPLELQAKLLRVLQEREFQRLGSSETISVDVRVIAASNVNLLEKVRRGLFREDLFYRLNVVPIHLPALRERKEDIPLLACHFIAKHCHLEGLPVKSAGRELLERLARQNWPGNVRQLENAVEMAIALSGDRIALGLSDFPTSAPEIPMSLPIQPARTLALQGEEVDFERALIEFERSMLVSALERTGGNRSQAAEMLGLKRTTFLTKLRSLETRGVLDLTHIA